MIYVVRHGETDWNKLHKVMGRVDIPLNETGKSQAKITSEKLKEYKIDLIISSPLKRACETAKIINETKNLEIIYDDRLLERDFGEFEGLDYNERYEALLWDYYENKEYEKTERMDNFFKRIYDLCNEIKEKYKDKNILLVTHGGVSAVLNCYYNNNIPKGPLNEKGIFLKNCEIAIYNK